jgi:hypothetical protein
LRALTLFTSCNALSPRGWPCFGQCGGLCTGEIQCQDCADSRGRCYRRQVSCSRAVATAISRPGPGMVLLIFTLQFAGSQRAWQSARRMPALAPFVTLYACPRGCDDPHFPQCATPLFGQTATLVVYLAAKRDYARLNQAPWVNPVSWMVAVLAGKYFFYGAANPTDREVWAAPRPPCESTVTRAAYAGLALGLQIVPASLLIPLIFKVVTPPWPARAAW